MKIIITIDENGNTKIKTEGIMGKACFSASQFLEDTLGKVVETKKTSEYYENGYKEKVRIQNGD